MDPPADDSSFPDLTGRQLGALCLSILLVALCGIVYELIIGAVSSYLLGNSVVQFSLTIGLFMFAMGLGSYISKSVQKNLVDAFVLVEVAISIVGGLSSLILFLVFPTVPALYKATMYGLIILIGTLVGFEIPVLTRILSHRQGLKDSIANVLSLDYLGALIGSIAFPLLLLPHLGLISCSFAVGLMNIIVAFLNLLAFRGALAWPKRLWFTALLGLAVMIGGTVVGQYLTRFAESQLYADQVIFQKQTPYQRVVFTRNALTGEYRLYLDGHLQFAQRDEHRYHEALVHPVMAVPGPKRRVLILGGGDGMAARELFKYPEVEQIDLVDIDPAVTAFCRSNPTIKRINHGALDDPRVTVHHQDAFVFIQKKREPYDRVIIDLPDPHNEALDKLYTVDFYRLIAKQLAPGGAIGSQSSSPFMTRETYWCIGNTMEAAGYHRFSYNIQVPTFGVWGFHIGSLRPVDPEALTIEVETQFLSTEILRCAGVFGKDIARMETPVNRLLEPKLYMIYNRELHEVLPTGVE